jgi:hypothetical protein
VGPDAIATLDAPKDARDGKPFTVSGPREINLDEAGLDVSTLEVRCKPKAGPKPK